MASAVKKATQTSRLASTTAIALCIVTLSACGGSKATPIGASNVPLGTVPQFSFDSLDARPVSSHALRGRVTVITFVTTWDLMSQAQVEFLAVMAKRDGAKVNYAAVALQRYADRELIEVYRTKLGLPYPFAIAGGADDPSVAPFVPFEAVPTTIVLDKEGHIAFRKTGLVKSDELRSAMRGL